MCHHNCRRLVASTSGFILGVVEWLQGTPWCYLSLAFAFEVGSLRLSHTVSMPRSLVAHLGNQYGSFLVLMVYSIARKDD